MFEHISAFDFTYEIVQTKTKKTEINLNIEFERAVLSTVSVSRKKLWNYLGNPCSKRRKEIIPSCLVITSRLKKSVYKGGTKIVPPRFLSRPTSHINSPLL